MQSDLFDSMSEWAVNFIANHPKLSAILACIVAVSIAVQSGFRAAWPLENERPRWVRFVIGCLSPFAFDYKRVFIWLVKRFTGIDLVQNAQVRLNAAAAVQPPQP